MAKKKYDVVEIEETQQVEQKKPWLQRMVYGIVGPGGLKDVVGGAVKSIVLPGLKNIAADALHGAVNSIFYRNGDAPSSRRGVYRHYENEYRGYASATNIESKYSNVKRLTTSGSRVVKPYAIETEEDAWDIVDDLRDRISAKGYATVGDYYENIGKPADSSHDDYGWKSLGGVEVIPVSNGWLIEFPPVRRVR